MSTLVVLMATASVKRVILAQTATNVHRVTLVIQSVWLMTHANPTPAMDMVNAT